LEIYLSLYKAKYNVQHLLITNILQYNIARAYP
jgi:hypothetical protein